MILEALAFMGTMYFALGAAVLALCAILSMLRDVRARRQGGSR